MINLYGISNILATFTSVTMSIFVFIKGYKYRMTRLWAFFSLSVATYGFGAYLVTTAHNTQEAVFYWQIAYIGIILIPFFFIFFIFEFLNIKHPLFFKINIILTSLFLFANFFSTKLFINNCTLYFEDIKWVTPIYFVFPPGFLLYFFIIYSFFGSIIYAHFEIFANYKKASVAKRNQIKYFVFATAAGFTGGGASFLPCFGFSVYPFLNFTVFLYPIIMTYAILRYRLMDISIAVTRTGTFVAVYTLVLGLPFALAIWTREWLIEAFGTVWWMLPLGLMAALATSGPFIYIFLERRAENRLLKDQRRYQDTLKQASIGMTRIRNLRRLLSLITHIVTKTVRISYAAIYLYNKETNEFVLQVSRDHNRKFLVRLSADDNALINWLIEKREPLIYEEVKRQLEDFGDAISNELEKNMRSLGASVVIPSFLEDRFMGFIVLGDKVSGQIYTAEDLNVFRVLASQAALAIENAQFYEETKEMQQQIAQAEKMATVGTMADGLSHQINNRFYALALIAGDTIDTIKMADTSKCAPEMKEMIRQINYALGRIQTNVMQGGEVVKGILKYTRKGEEKFEGLTLDNIIDGTLDMVQYKVKLSEIDFVREYSKGIPQVKGNMVQLQEVFFNLIDNAYDAIVERRDTLREPGYRGKITVSAQPKNGFLEIIVRDNGMGVKNPNVKKLFTPFFTTKTSVRKGTGLGLYVINRIITDTHKGKISFESQYKLGTRFIIELPRNL